MHSKDVFPFVVSTQCTNMDTHHMRVVDGVTLGVYCVCSDTKGGSEYILISVQASISVTHR